MKLLNISLEDLSLYESVHCDERMMAHLGGSWLKEQMPQKLRRDVALVESGRAWVFKIIPDDSGLAVGTVCIWENTWRGGIINEIGWMILPQFQGRGRATQAVRAILDKACSEQRWREAIHAFPSITNEPSNAVCLKTGFSRIEECDIEYASHLLRCNHWRLDLPPIKTA